MKEANLEVDVSLLCSTYINMWFDYLGNMLEWLIITRVWTTGMYSRKPKTWISLWRPLRVYHVLLFSWVIFSTPAILSNSFTIPEDAMPWWCAWYLQTTCPPQQSIRHQYNHFQQSRDRQKGQIGLSLRRRSRRLYQRNWKICRKGLQWVYNSGFFL